MDTSLTVLVRDLHPFPVPGRDLGGHLEGFLNANGLDSDIHPQAVIGQGHQLVLPAGCCC